MAKFVWHDKQLTAKITHGANNAIEAMCEHLVNDIRSEMKPGSYRKWPSKKGDGSMHWSSQPGDAPSPDTHALQDSISYSTSGGKQSGVGSRASVGNVGSPAGSPNESVGIVGTQDIKGQWLEILPEMGGGATGMEPRPFIRPALPRNKVILPIIFDNAMMREMK